jgi:hypothetical protein
MVNMPFEESCPVLVDIDTSTKKMHIPMNALPQEINTPLFCGRILFIHQQPGQWRYEHAFQGKEAMFEVQVQGRFKKPPSSRLYLGIETEEPLKAGMMTHYLCQAIFAMMKNVMGDDSHLLKWSFGQGQRGGYIYYPVSKLCHIVDATPPGMTPPELGTRDLYTTTHTEPAEFDRLLSQVNPKTWEEGYVFTIAWHTLYFDFSHWTLSNVPGMRPMSLETFWGKKRNICIFMFSAPKEKEEELEHQEHFVRTKLRWIGGSPMHKCVQADGQISETCPAESERAAGLPSRCASSSDLESFYTAHSRRNSRQEDPDVQVDDSSSSFSSDLPLREEAVTSDSDDSCSFSASKGRLSKVSNVPLAVQSDSRCVPAAPFCVALSALWGRSAPFYNMAHFCS